jgi:Bifunctional DNA primase/polymerase, N-terminal
VKRRNGPQPSQLGTASTQPMISRGANQVQDIDSPQRPASPTDLMGWALSYAKQGIAVFPCKWWLGIGSKAPLVPPPGFHLATTDPMQITDWWIRWPKALIGSPVPESRCVIDIDPRNGGSVEKLEKLTGAPIRQTLTVWSGRNDGGKHLVYRRPPGDLTQTRIKKIGVDLKDGGKGYTILPPSRHPVTQQPYRWEIHPVASMSLELYELIKYEKPVAQWPVDATEKKLLGLLRTMSGARQGERNQILYWAGCRLAEAPYPESAWQALAQIAETTGLARGEIHNTIRSARRIGDDQ